MPPEVPGVLCVAEVLESGQFIAGVQQANGMIPWSPGAHCDPWNHVEAAMALDVCGLEGNAERAYEWLVRSQLPDGSWFNYYRGASVDDQRLDTNVCAYVATGAWHHYLVTGSEEHLWHMWPTVDRAISFVLRWQRPDGAVSWSIDRAGFREGYSLLTGSSSIYLSLRAGVAIAERLGKERPEWELAAGRLGHAVAHHPGSFASKDEFAMDWYYPVLSGALTHGDAIRRMEMGWDTFVLEGVGVRCISTADWVTAAETAECVLALDALGLADRAKRLFADVQQFRLDDGSYWTGMAFPDAKTFPVDERTTYTAAAIVLAADALSGATRGGAMFRGESLAPCPDLAESACPGNVSECGAPLSLGAQTPEDLETALLTVLHPEP